MNKNEDKIKYFEDADHLKQYAENIVKEDKNSLFVPEGALFEPSYNGTLTLPLDVLRNEEINNIKFNNIFIDCGTGLTSSSKYFLIF